MEDEMKLKLIKQEDFLGIKCDFYKDMENNNIYMTREQIGESMQYSNGRVAIAKVHSRNKERLDKFSVGTKLVSTDGKQYQTILYNYQGIYEITFMSRQPVAEEFRDWVFDQMEMIRKTGMTMPDTELALKEVFSGLDEDLQVAIVESYKSKYEEVSRELEEAKPKADSWEAYMDIKGNMTIANVAKALNIKGIGRNNMFKILKEREILRANNEPYQTFVDRGYFKVLMGSKNGFKFSQTVVTGKGMGFINKKMKEWGIA